jgi:outer membrane receptor protein involved in Fe transport
MAATIDLIQLNPKNKLGFAISAVCAGVAPSAFAQQDNDRRIEEVVVTATKREAVIQDIPMSIQAFTDADIVRQGFKQLNDYIGQIPALSAATRQPYGSNVIMRGCATSGLAFADTQSTAVYLDEQPISVAGVNPDPRLVDISRVEALSGPQGTLFGDASQCGTLRILTNRPDTTEFDSWIELTANTVEHGDSGYDISGMVNIPFANDKMALRLVGFYAEEPGYVDNIFGVNPSGPEDLYGARGSFDNAEFVQADINEVTVSGGRAILRWAPSENWTLDLGGIYQNTEGDGLGDTDLPEDGHAGDPLGEWEQMRFGTDTWQDEWYQFSLTTEGSLGWGDLTIAASFMNRQASYDVDSTAYIAAWNEFYPDKVVYNIYDWGGDPQAKSFDVSDQDRYSLEIRLATPADSDSRWGGVVGFFYNKSDDHTHFSANVRQFDEVDPAYPNYLANNAAYYLNYVAFHYCRGGYVAGLGCPSGIYDPLAVDAGPYLAPTVKWWDGVYNTELEQMAIFGEVNIDITDWFNLTLGGRFFDIDQDRSVENGTMVASSQPFTVQGPEIKCDEISAPTPIPGGPTIETQQLCNTGPRNLAGADETGFVPKITTTFNVADDKMIYATYSEGFRRGGGNAARDTSIFGRPPLDTYESDLVKNYEIGTKTTWFNGRFQFNLTAYHMVWEDMQIEAEDPTPNVFTLGIINLAEAEIDGIESFINWVPTDGLSLNATVGWNDGEVSEDSSFSDITVAKGTQLPLAPDWKASVVADYVFNRDLWGTTPSLYLAYQYTGESVNSLLGIQSIETQKPVRTQEDYSIVNFRAGLEGETWTATFFIDNLTDEYAQQFYNDRWIQTRLSVNRPRTFGITYRKGFGSR